ncbi:MAG TPA: ABC transporter permease [Chloroflexi bacterium]|nr:ABC transporter permease [Chloroflexota bacterium]
MHINLKQEVKRSNFAVFGIVTIVLLLIIAVFGPLLAPYDPLRQTSFAFQSPSFTHWLGTNHVGQDILSQLIYGARTSLLVGFSAALLATILSAIIGTSAALVGGLYDKIVMRIVDAFIVIPAIIVIILVAAYFKPNLLVLILLLALLGWQDGARTIRAQALSLREMGHISAARSYGAGNLYLIIRHILPDLVPILLMGFIYGIRRAIFMEAGLAFLGIADPTTVSWGTMIHEALDFCYLNVWQWWLIPPGVALSLTILSVTGIGHTLEGALDPRLRSETNA